MHSQVRSATYDLHRSSPRQKRGICNFAVEALRCASTRVECADNLLRVRAAGGAQIGFAFCPGQVDGSHGLRAGQRRREG
eukprot:422660-Pyramimonas_sp.AAC.1